MAKLLIWKYKNRRRHKLEHHIWQSVHQPDSKKAKRLRITQVANPSLSHKWVHHSIVTRFPNHWWATSCDTTIVSWVEHKHLVKLLAIMPFYHLFYCFAVWEYLVVHLFSISTQKTLKLTDQTETASQVATYKVFQAKL